MLECFSSMRQEGAFSALWTFTREASLTVLSSYKILTLSDDVTELRSNSINGKYLSNQ